MLYTTAVTARLGYEFLPGALAFARVGWVHSSCTGSLSLGSWAASQTEDFDGLRVGVGSEMQVAGQLTFRVDYTYDFYAAKDFGTPVSFEQCPRSVQGSVTTTCPAGDDSW
jgi:opacity protein-like surface antigen